MTRHATWMLAPILIATLSGCASVHYKNTDAGTLKGRVIVEWYEPDLFIYRPDATKPFIFTRKNGVVVEPGTMYTNGGSIPRPFWLWRNYSPWGYGPAFVVHDWLFHQQNCKEGDYQDYTLKEAAKVMSEVIKTLMESPKFDYGSKSSMYLMYEAVQSPPAAEAWGHGECTKPSDIKLERAPDATFLFEVK